MNWFGNRRPWIIRRCLDSIFHWIFDSTQLFSPFAVCRLRVWAKIWVGITGFKRHLGTLTDVCEDYMYHAFFCFALLKQVKQRILNSWQWNMAQNIATKLSAKAKAINGTWLKRPSIHYLIFDSFYFANVLSCIIFKGKLIFYWLKISLKLMSKNKLKN